MEQLSGVMIIVIIGGGVLTFVLLFIFAKRQIMRFALRNRRGPHVPVGNDTKKAIRREIERRIDCIQKIAKEPKLLWTDDKYIIQKDQQQQQPYYYRMKAVDDVKILEREILRSDGSARHAFESLRAFLLTTLCVTLNGTGQRMIHQFCDMYEHARHDPNEFGNLEYETYYRLLLKLIDAAKQLKNFSNSRKTSPARTPKKQTKMQSLLDPSRLKPPPLNAATVNTGGLTIPPSSELTAGQHSKVNLTLGLKGADELDDTIEIAANPLHLHTQAERDNIIRNRIKTPTLDDVVNVNVVDYDNEDDDDEDDDDDDDDEHEVASISSVQFHGNASVV